MRPRTYFCAAIADYSNATLTLAAPAPPDTSLVVCARRQFLSGQTVDVVTLEIFARGFGLLVVEPGEAGPVEHAVTFMHGFGKRIGSGEQARGLALDGDETLPGFLLGRKGADLDHPATTGLRSAEFDRGSKGRAGAGAGTGSTLAKASGAASGAGAGSGARAADDSGNGNSEAVCTWAVPGFTFSVFTITGRIGSVEPGDGRAFAAGTVVGGSSRTGVLTALATS